MFKEVVTDVFFDLDHTLWDFEKNSAITFNKILLDNKVDIKLEDFLKVYIPINLEYWKLFREEKITKEELRFFRLKKVFDTLEYKVQDQLVHKLSDDYIDHLSSFNHLFTNAIEILDYLKPNYQLHIITNGFQAVQERKLKNSNIREYFSNVVDSEMAGVKKPNPEIFKLALCKANTTPRKSIMIGDSIEADILGAKAVGFHTLHFNAHNEERHDYCDMIHDLNEIKKYL
ncbi:putative hydrolase of the HAD superfamily [Maribacter vaceletii]|uniref:Putative hydrolase of the HAD superfamily n=1 Tax=Maribacter vaceletii TaxID=1206816 RepID=A0A495EBU3_9FLAO|nr:YjjG family noncanonical pyrimidine nucleotidase [Maribacter vaceletii]RKR14023.1 putative hydrolase of the HAD superfamily [Maribacter vaceletii]